MSSENSFIICIKIFTYAEVNAIIQPMDKIEAILVIEEIKSGKVFYKPLPFNENGKGGTFISYDSARDIFVEEYVNECYEERCPGVHFFTERTAEQMMNMLLKQDYTDKHYSTMGSFEKYDFIEKNEVEAFARCGGVDWNSLHPNDQGYAKCSKCKTMDVTITHYDYSINPVTGDRYVNMRFVCNKCGHMESGSWDE